MDISSILNKSGYKLTRPRLSVFDCLQKSGELLSVKDLRKKIKGIDQVSVYRVLSLFEKLDLVNVEVLGNEKLYCLADRPHHHIICRECGYFEDFACDKNKEYKNFKNFSNIQHRLTLTGLCGGCKSKI